MSTIFRPGPAFFVDPASPIRPHDQLKDQIKLAYATGKLRQGDRLPSVRVMARLLGVGETPVRRAYRELASLGLVTARRARHVVVNPALPPTAGGRGRADRAVTECQRVLRWSEKHGLSSVAIARLLMQLALERETRRSSYRYIDASATMASEFADRISKVLGIPVGGMTLDDVRRSRPAALGGVTAFLVNSYQYENALRLLPAKRRRLFPVRVHQGENLLMRARRLAAGSRVLLVLSPEDHARIGPAVVQRFRELVGKDLRFEAASFRANLDWPAQLSRYRLIVASAHVWDEIPERVRRSRRVVRSQSEPDLQSIEELRLAAGVVI